MTGIRAARIGRRSFLTIAGPIPMMTAFLRSRTNMRAAVVFLLAARLHAETGRDAWLRYTPAPRAIIPAVITTTTDSPLINTARDELVKGIRGMTGRTLRMES